MNTEKLAEAKKHAQELIIRIEALEKKSAVTLARYNMVNSQIEQGAVKRQSMELTRALANLRKP